MSDRRPFVQADSSADLDHLDSSEMQLTSTQKDKVASASGIETLDDPSGKAKKPKHAPRRYHSDDEDSHHHHGPASLRTTLFLTYLSIGTVFGDLGTSPLYTFATVFSGKVATEERVEGVMSIIFWAFTLVCIVKYASIVLRADDNGEGGTIALYSLLCRFGDFSLGDRDARDLTMSSFTTRSFMKTGDSGGSDENESAERRKRIIAIALQGFVIFGVSLLLGDGVLTPSISVLSAVEGIAVQVESFRSAVVPVTCVILFLFFVAQSLGTGRISGFFSPIVILWLLANAAIGVYNISSKPAIFRTLSPSFAFQFFIDEGQEAWKMLGGIMLCITGTEALFADLGHFSRPAIQLATIAFVYPCLMLTYLGQAAAISLNLDPAFIEKAYWKSVPQPVFWPMFVLAILATIVASQALVSASFSIVKQCMALKCFPQVKIIHTSDKHAGQIYSPDINYLLMIACIILVIAFGSSDALASAYGIAVCLDAFMTTCLVTIVMKIVWDLPWAFPIAFFLIFGLIDMSFLTANLLKVPHGGWFPLVLAFVISCIMGIWRWGKAQATKYRYRFRRGYHDIFRVLALSSPMGETNDEVDPEDEDFDDDLGNDDEELKLAPETDDADTAEEEKETTPVMPLAVAEIDTTTTPAKVSPAAATPVRAATPVNISPAASPAAAQPAASPAKASPAAAPTAAPAVVTPIADSTPAPQSTAPGSASPVATPTSAPHAASPAAATPASAPAEATPAPAPAVATLAASPSTASPASAAAPASPASPALVSAVTALAATAGAEASPRKREQSAAPSVKFSPGVSTAPAIQFAAGTAPAPAPAAVAGAIDLPGVLGVGLGQGLPAPRTLTSGTDRRIQIIDPRPLPGAGAGANGGAPGGGMARAEELGDITRYPGVGFYYTETGKGIPGVFAHWVNCVGSIPQVVVFVTLRHTTVPHVHEGERWHVQKLFLDGFWKATVTYGYLDRAEDGTVFAQKLVERVTKMEKRFAGFSTDDINTKLDSPSDPTLEPTRTASDVAIADAARRGVTYFLGKKNLKAKVDSSLLRKILLQIYKFEVRNSRRSKSELQTPDDRTIEIGLHMSI